MNKTFTSSFNTTADIPRYFASSTATVATKVLLDWLSLNLMQGRSNSLTSIEEEDIRADSEEREKGLTRSFSSTDDLFEWLDSD